MASLTPLLSHSRHSLAEILQNSRSQALKLGHHPRLAGLPKSTPPPIDPIVIDFDQHFPIPEPPLAELLALGVDLATRERLSSAYLQTAKQLRAKCEQLIHRTLAALPHSASRSSTQARITAAYKSQYMQMISTWAEDVLESCRKRVMDHHDSRAISRVVQRSSSSPSAKHNDRRPFNNEYVPVLDYYFQHNPFPSHADRMFLAQKSNMNHDQIYVWFQNRRRKYKEKTGVQLKKEDYKSCKTMQSMDPMVGQMPAHLVVPEEERKPYVDSDATEYEIEYDSSDVESPVTYVPSREPEAVDVLNTPAPPHAFPTTYPPPPELNPFPIKSGVRNFPAPEWRRRPATKPIKHAPVDIAKLTDAFAKMQVKYTNFARTVRKDKDNIRGKKRRTTPPVAKPDRAAATAAITTQVPPAPLPAFVRRTEFLAPRRQRPVPAPTVPAPASRLHPFRSPSPMAQPATLVPSARLEADTPTPRRKVAGLPKRTPTGSSRAHRGVSSASSVSSIASPRSSPSRTLDSRTSSFTSTASSQRVSSGSSFASEAITPDASFAALPEIAPSPSNSFSQFDFAMSSSNMTDLFGDATFPSDVDLSVPQWQYGVQSVIDLSRQLSAMQKAPSFDFSFAASPTPVS